MLLLSLQLAVSCTSVNFSPFFPPVRYVFNGLHWSATGCARICSFLLTVSLYVVPFFFRFPRSFILLLYLSTVSRFLPPFHRSLSWLCIGLSSFFLSIRYSVSVTPVLTVLPYCYWTFASLSGYLSRFSTSHISPISSRRLFSSRSSPVVPHWVGEGVAAVTIYGHISTRYL